MTEANERDLIDDLIDQLNDGVDQVTFDRDVLDTDRPDDWGAVELTGQESSDWADGAMIEQELTADVWVCAGSRKTRIKRQVQQVLAGFCRATGGGWTLKARAYLYDLDKVMWRWVVTAYAPLYQEPEDEEPEDDFPEGNDDPDPDGDPEEDS